MRHYVQGYYIIRIFVISDIKTLLYSEVLELLTFHPLDQKIDPILDDFFVLSTEVVAIFHSGDTDSPKIEALFLARFF